MGDPTKDLGRTRNVQDRPLRDPEQPKAGEPESWLVEALADVQPHADLSSQVGRKRLLDAASSGPHRYAPFYDRLAALWDLSEPALKVLFTVAAERRAWRPVWPGLRMLGVSAGPKLSDARARLLRFEPDFRFPNHRHSGVETVLVLEGSYTDSSGVTLRAGDSQQMEPGSAHELRVGAEGPCIAAVAERGVEFTGPILKRLARWF